ncbi:MAG TPA: hypothetical protein VG713_09315, partial [Pirellulales bacterium]|nr:hypothetical protein [Pirellulales bacterium]
RRFSTCGWAVTLSMTWAPTQEFESAAPSVAAIDATRASIVAVRVMVALAVSTTCGLRGAVVIGRALFVPLRGLELLAGDFLLLFKVFDGSNRAGWALFGEEFLEPLLSVPFVGLERIRARVAADTFDHHRPLHA